MNRKRVLWVAVGLVCGLGCLALLLGGGSPAYTFRFDNVSRGDLSVKVTTTGTVSPVVSVDVGTQVSGIISNLYADFNSVVKKGQVIARIDTTTLWNSVVTATAQLESARALAEQSRKVFIREKELVEKQLDSQAAYDSAFTADKSNQESLAQAKTALDLARINLAYATIRAPVSGIVINRAVSIGETVAASYSSPVLYTIADDMSKMQVLTTVDESDIGMIAVGQTATFSVEAYADRKFSGVVSQIRLAPVSIQNVVNYTVVIDVDNSDLKLMPGMTADVDVGVASARDVLKVPNLALRFQPPADLVDSSRLREAGPAIPPLTGPSGDALASGSLTRGTDPVSANKRRQAPPLIARSVPRHAPETAFGITNLYPQFERPPYVPQHQGPVARVWILDGQNRLEPVYVRTGVTDGRSTEVASGVLKPGDRIVLGAQPASGDYAGSNPLAAGTQGGGRGMR